MCEIEISHMGKNNGNLDLVCEKQTCLMVSDYLQHKEDCITTEDVQLLEIVDIRSRGKVVI